ncbi:MAG TPA: hemerythrin domain-containing protein [Nitrososphaerales archaeon]|nr:hemerythrin domain-containing protein [Nitrososphaerales archaeon]
MTMSLDYNEPLPKVVERLKDEHRELVPKLRRIEKLAKSGDLKVIATELNAVKPLLLRHAVEEEARLMRAIMWEFEEKADESIIILRYHRELVEFFEHRLPKLTTLPDRVARREVGIFVKGLRKHHLEEEKTLFPLALKADSLYEKGNRTG